MKLDFVSFYTKELAAANPSIRHLMKMHPDSLAAKNFHSAVMRKWGKLIKKG